MTVIQNLIQISHPKKRHNLPTPKYQTFVTIPQGYSSALHLYRYKQFIPKWKKRLQLRHFVKPFRTTPKYNTYATVPIPATVIQVYPLKQILPKHRKIIKIRKIHHALESLIKYDTWVSIFNPEATVEQYINALQIFPYRRLSVQLRHKLSLRRHLNTKYGTPKFLDTPIIPPVIVDIFNPVLQPYLLKQLIPKFKHKILSNRKRKFAYGSPRFTSWRSIFPISSVLDTINVKTISNILKAVFLPK